MTRSIWGWGDDGAALDERERRGLERRVAPLLGSEVTWAEPPRVEDLDLAPVGRSVRNAPASIAARLDTDPRARAAHTYGKSFRDVVRGLAGDFTAAPDAVARPTSEREVGAILAWAGDAEVIVVPFGGGSSVTGGVETPLEVREGRDVVSMDLAGLAGIHEIDHRSRAARIGGGTYGPAIEDGLRAHGLTLRHYPQSFEFSTLGGWLATRSGGHFATLHTHLDDFVESITAVTPAGRWESRRLPGSGAGPSPDRLMLGSEGTLGVITEAWMRLQDRPVHRRSFVAAFGTFAGAAEAARRLAQSGLWPQNCRVLDSLEALVNGAGDGSSHLLLVAFESAHVPVDGDDAAARDIVRGAGGTVPDAEPGPSPSPAGTGSDTGREPEAAETWRASFLRAPYLRDGLVRLGLVNETFETAITWDRFDEFVDGVRADTTAALLDAGCGPSPLVTCRLTHVYPDGAAPYFTVIAPGRPGVERLAQWQQVKDAAMAAIVGRGGTVTHHHSVGRDHAEGYRHQVPRLFRDALRAVKAELDPCDILNPGILVDP